MKKKSIHAIMHLSPFYFLPLLMLLFITCSVPPTNVRNIEHFCQEWKFHLGDIPNGQEPTLDDSNWQTINLPHDWSIEGEFSESHPASPGGGALPGGIGWYRKTFTMPESEKNHLAFIEFDGVYRNSEVWINGHYLGKRPYGYISFQYELTSYLKYGADKNVLAVKVDNSQQPNSRWYSGSGIYRNVWLVSTEQVHVDHWGTFVSTPDVNPSSAEVVIKTKVRNASDKNQSITLTTSVRNEAGEEGGKVSTNHAIPQDSALEIIHELNIENPVMWSIEGPNLYKALTTIRCNGMVCDDYQTTFGIRTFHFDANEGFFLNGNPVKIKGVCNHHDLGCLGAAVNKRAIERQLETLKDMGCNGIRTSHNPPAPELLDLCDRMGFIVMDEAFDMWKVGKTEFDYHLDFDEWHKRDMADLILRDRNHPSVFIWSIGNEIMEQWDKEDSSGSIIAKELATIVRGLDSTRPVTAACNDISPLNPLIRSGALDLIGYNYSHKKYVEFPETCPGKKLIASETESALATRGAYDMPSDSIRRWPTRWDVPFLSGNPDYTCSSYDNCSAPWGSTHEETWKVVKKYSFVSGIYTWTGFDYLGEPTPYGWPARSSYFGIIDLAGFPKDAFYLYQSEWTDKPVLHVFPHWNWEEGQTIDVWVYTNCEEVELFLNNESQGMKKKTVDELHLMWRLSFKPGVLKAIGRINEEEILTKEIKTAGKPAKLILEADKALIAADGRDLAFVTVKILDENGTLVPRADNLVNFKISGEGRIVGVDNGLQISHEPFQANHRKAFNGLCLAVVQSGEKTGQIELKATSEGLEESTVIIKTK
jgi:beta-galactosidase